MSIMLRTVGVQVWVPSMLVLAIRTGSGRYMYKGDFAALPQYKALHPKP